MHRLWPTLLLLLSAPAVAAPLVVWTHFSAGDLKWLQAQARAFERRTGQPLAVSPRPFAQLPEQWRTAARGRGPDVVVGFPGDWLGQMVQGGKVLPLGLADTGAGTEAAALTVRGQQWGFPLMAESVALVYNKKFVSRPPATWAEFLRVARANTSATTYGFVTDPSSPYLHYGLVRAFGGYVFGERGGQTEFSDLGLANSGAVKAATLLHDLRFVNRLVPAHMDAEQARQTFLEGRAAMTVLGSWEVGALRQAGLDFGVAPLPRPDGAQADWQPFVGVQGVVLGKGSPPLALDFARQLSTPEAQVELYRASGRIPASAAARARLEGDPVVAGFDRVFRQGTALPPDAEMNLVWEPWSAAWQQIMASPSPKVSALLEAAAEHIRAGLQGWRKK